MPVCFLYILHASRTRPSQCRVRQTTVSLYYFLLASSSVLIFALLGNLNTASGAQHTLDVTVDGELTSSQCANHEETCTDTGKAASKAKLLADLDQAAGGRFARQALGLVDLAEHRVGRLGDDGGCETSNQTRPEVYDGVRHRGSGVLVDKIAVNGLGDLFVDNEFGHRVGNPAKSE